MSQSKLPAACVLDAWVQHDWSDGLQIDAVEDMAAIRVQTLNHIYEITVIDGARREILVRGGRFFPEWTPGILAGSSLRGSLLKLGGIYVGFRLEIVANGETVITSRIQSIDLNAERS